LLLPALALIVRGNDARRLWFILAGAWVMFGMGRFLFFVPGILAVYVSQIPSVVRWAKSWHASLGIICIAIALPLVTGTGFGIRALVATTLLFVPIACGNNLFGLLNLRGLRLMGIISYSVYLLHGIVLYLARPVLAQAKHQGANGVWLFWSYVLGLACITLIFCMLTYRWIESPFINIERMRRQSPRTADIVHSAAEQAAAASKDIS
jgi:peptidoglycan/LPS O-acetylase OafA/YrhL